MFMRFQSMLLVVGFSCCLNLALLVNAADKPNIIIVMTDDMGYSDLGCYGGEIKTPAIDRMAREGVRFTQFYNTGRCCPTRATLISGLYAHQAGMGHMTGDLGPENPGYRGRLNRQCVTIAEVLQHSGYFTIHTGKWHLGANEKDWWPLQRGFDRHYGIPHGGGFFFTPKCMTQHRTVVRGNEEIYNKVNEPPKGWYTTDAWTDEGLTFVKEAIAADKPFFWYLAHNAPHWPLQAKPEDIAKYRGKYRAGWDAIRKERLGRMQALGLLDPKWQLTERDAKVPAWETLSEKDRDLQDLRMATYAAMIDCVDQNMAKIFQQLKELNIDDNTIVMFLQDNGGCAEGGHLGSGKGECGTPMSYHKYGACWANASNTPFRRYKHFVHEGGAATPLVVRWPAAIPKQLNGQLITEPTHLIDLMPTCVAAAGATYPTEYKGNKIPPFEGKDLFPLLQGADFSRSVPLFFEHEGNLAIRDGQWKLVSAKGGDWELYDMQADRTETNDLARKQPEMVRELSGKWDAWADRAMVRRTSRKR